MNCARETVSRCMAAQETPAVRRGTSKGLTVLKMGPRGSRGSAAAPMPKMKRSRGGEELAQPINTVNANQADRS